MAALDRQHVHTVHRCAQAPVAARLAGDVGLRLVALQRRAHRVEIVLAEEQHGQLPERGEVQRLVEFPFGHRPVAEEAGRDPVERSCSLSARASPTAMGSPPPDNGIAAVEAARHVEQVHRPATSAAAAVGLAVHLGHERAGRDAPRQRMAVLAVRGHDGIIRREGLHGPDGHRLLADVEVEETVDLAHV